MNLQLRPKSVLQAKFGDAMDLDVVGKVNERRAKIRRTSQYMHRITFALLLLTQILV